MTAFRNQRKQRPAAQRAVASALCALLAAGPALFAGDQDHDGDHGRGQDKDHFQFRPGTLVLSRSIYKGTASTVTVG